MTQSENLLITKERLDFIYANKLDIDSFKAVDPCGIVHLLAEHTDRQLDIELGALFVCMIAWGNRKAIRGAATHMLKDEMKWSPAEFILQERYENSYATAKNECVYRTLNVSIFKEVCRRIRDGLNGFETMEERFSGMSTKEVIATICCWLSPAKIGTMDKSACKRVCMFARWMTRCEEPDFGVWKSRDPGDLYAVMDVHVCQLTRSLLRNKRPTWKACEELTSIFKEWDETDPLKYDIALMTLADSATE